MSTKILFCILFLPLSSLLICCHMPSNPHIIIKTELGDITLELYADKAPITVRNFMRYVNENRLQGTRFYRTVTTQPDNQPDKAIKIDVVQGGFALNMVDTINNPLLLPPIAHETTDKTGILHLDGTISMARDMPGTAQAEFFICIGNQPELDFGGKRNPDGAGFAAFGKVIKGMNVVHKIHQQPNEAQMITNPIPILSVKAQK